VAVRALTGTCLAVALTTACAPDAWRSDPGFNRWIDRVAQECYPRSIGGAQLSDRFSEAAFLDLTSRAYHRLIEVKQYTGSVDSFYPGDNRAALECIVSRLPPTVSPR
jgi:hypothetical protein